MIEEGSLRVPSHRGNLQAVRAMFSDAVRDELLARNPFAQLGLPQSRGRSDLVVLTDSELALLVRTAAIVWEEFGRSMIGPLITVAAGLGLRPGEIYGLRWPAVSFTTGEVYVLRQRQSRTGEEVLPGRRVRRQRVVVMPEHVADSLHRVPRRAEDDHVFWSQDGEPLSTRTFGYYWRPLSSCLPRTALGGAAGRDRKLTLYCLRHLYASRLAGLPGVTADVVAEQLGHADGGQLALQRYVHRRSDEARDKVRVAMRQPSDGARSRRG